MSIDIRTESSLDTYETPQWLVAEIKAFFGGSIDLDPCTSASNPVGAARFMTEANDGLRQEWNRRSDTAYVNSPYGRALKAWAQKCVEEAASLEIEIIQLAPARFGAGWFKYLAENCHAFGVFNKRLAFTLDGQPVTDKKGKPCTAQFDAVLAYYGPRREEFREHFAQYLTYWRLG